MIKIFLYEYLLGLVVFYVVAALVGKFLSLGAWRSIHHKAFTSPALRGEVFNNSSFSRSGPNGGGASAGFGWLVIIVSLICIAIFIPMEMSH
jgi:hypothetical protein